MSQKTIKPLQQHSNCVSEVCQNQLLTNGKCWKRTLEVVLQTAALEHPSSWLDQTKASTSSAKEPTLILEELEETCLKLASLAVRG